MANLTWSGLKIRDSDIPDETNMIRPKDINNRKIIIEIGWIMKLFEEKNNQNIYFLCKFFQIQIPPYFVCKQTSKFILTKLIRNNFSVHCHRKQTLGFLFHSSPGCQVKSLWVLFWPVLDLYLMMEENRTALTLALLTHWVWNKVKKLNSNAGRHFSRVPPEVQPTNGKVPGTEDLPETSFRLGHFTSQVHILILLLKCSIPVAFLCWSDSPDTWLFLPTSRESNCAGRAGRGALLESGRWIGEILV